MLTCTHAPIFSLPACLPLPACVCVQPEPCWGPEAVVLAQLAALQQGDAEWVFRFASPENQAATGPVERFQGMLQVHRTGTAPHCCGLHHKSCHGQQC